MLSLHRSLRPLHIYASPLLVASLPLARATTYNLHHPVFCQSQLGRVKPIKQDIPLNQSLERGDEVGRKGWFGGLVERFKDALRVLELTFVFVPLGILYVPCRCLGEGLERRWRALLVLTLQHFGPTFIKFGQWASTRADLFSAELRTAFANSLASNNAAQPFHVIKRTVCDAFHVDTLDQAFEEFAPEPIGAGCVAQVHKAKVRGRKRPVAVKVISGNVLEVLQRDLRILARVSWLLQLVLPEEFGLRNIVSQFGELMTKQVDLRIEARHLARFRDNFAKVDEVEFPEVVTVSSNGKVLVESFEQGVLLSELLASHATSAPDSPLRSQHLRKQIADVGLKCFLQMVLVDNFVHSDLHPGNIIGKFIWNTRAKSLKAGIDACVVRLKDDGAAKFESISVIDAGLVTTLSPSNKRNFIDLFLAVAHGDGKRSS